jgi:outer membrane scaffolding protein for murein synthesis (MipA/OmpV family)
MIIKSVAASVACAAALMGSAPTATADPLLVINVTVVVSPQFNRYNVTNVTVKQSNTAPNNSNGDVAVSVVQNRLAPVRGVRAGATVPVRSTRGQVR